MTTNRLGARVRALRRKEGLTQAEFARRLDISTSYLNLIENDRRPLTANILIRLASRFQVDLDTFSPDSEERLIRELIEVLGDPFFDEHGLASDDIRRLATTTPEVGRALIHLYREHQRLLESTTALTARLSDEAELPGARLARLPTEEVTDIIQANLNYFPDFEAGAEQLWRDARLTTDALSVRLVAYLEQRLNITVKVRQKREMSGALRRFDADSRQLALSEQLNASSRSFQLALQIGLLVMDDVLEAFTADSRLTSRDARVLCRVSLANYFAGAVLMPYSRMYAAAEAERYDIDTLSSRFQTSFEQVCHRLTTLRRPGAEGVPFHFVRVDIAGNISKRFSASGIRFARFGSACSRWNVYAALITPGQIRRQLSIMPDGTVYFCIAQAIQRGHGGYGRFRPLEAIGLGCTVEHAPRIVYADGIDLSTVETSSVPIGTSCRTCERVNCSQRAFPSLHLPMKMNENVRGLSFFSADGVND